MAGLAPVPVPLLVPVPVPVPVIAPLVPVALPVALPLTLPDPDPDPATLRFSCLHCLLLFHTFDAGTAHLASKHDINRPDRHLDVVQVLADPFRSRYIASARTEAARRLLASAEKAQDNHALKRRFATSAPASPLARPKIPRIGIPDDPIALALQAPNIPVPAPAPAPKPNPKFILLARGARIAFVPPPGVDSYHGLLASVAAAFDSAAPDPAPFDWLSAAGEHWVVVVCRVGGAGGAKKIAVKGDADVGGCLAWEVGEEEGRVGYARAMEVGVQ